MPIPYVNGHFQRAFPFPFELMMAAIATMHVQCCLLRNNCPPEALFAADVQYYCPEKYLPIKVGVTRGCGHDPKVLACLEDVGEGDTWLPAPHPVD